MLATFSRRTILQLAAMAPALRPLAAKLSAPERNSAVAESSAGDTLRGFEEFGYNRLATAPVPERRSPRASPSPQRTT